MQHQAGSLDFARTLSTTCLGTRIARLQRVAARRFDQELRPLGLSIPQMEILGALVLRQGPMRPSDLAGAMCAERSTISRNLAALQGRDWVAPADTSPTGRAMSVVVTPAGEARFASAQHAWNAAQAAVLTGLGPDAPAMFDGWLGALSSEH